MAISALPEPVRLVLHAGRRWDLSLVSFGLACCAVELAAASLRGSDLLRATAVSAGPADGTVPAGPLPVLSPEAADGSGESGPSVLVVSGTVTDKVAPAVVRLHAQLPDPTYVVSFGACANSGGPYWDSYSVTKGIDRLLPVDLYVPGCPPRPEALLAGLLRLDEALSAGPLSGGVAP